MEPASPLSEQAPAAQAGKCQAVSRRRRRERQRASPPSEQAPAAQAGKCQAARMTRCSPRVSSLAALSWVR